MAVDHGQSPVVHVPDLLDCQLQRLLLTPADQEKWGTLVLGPFRNAVQLRDRLLKERTHQVGSGNIQGLLKLLIDHLDLPLIVYDTDARINVADDALGNELRVSGLAQLVIGYFQKLHKLVDII